MVFQNYALYPHMTVFDNMAFSLKLRHAEKSTIDERVMRIAEILELTEYIKRYPRQLSGGQRQRVAMGRAIVRDPQVFLFDEPLSNLDAQLRVQMRTEIKALHQRLDSTSVYVTHDQWLLVRERLPLSRLGKLLDRHRQGRPRERLPRGVEGLSPDGAARSCTGGGPVHGRSCAHG